MNLINLHVQRYGVGIGSGVLASMLVLVLDNFTSLQYKPILLFTIAVMVSNWYINFTSRKQAEISLLLAERKFSEMLDNIPDVFVVYDAQQRIQFVNATGVRISKRPKEEFIGRKDDELWPSSVTDSYLPLLKKTVETKKKRFFRT